MNNFKTLDTQHMTIIEMSLYGGLCTCPNTADAMTHKQN